MYIIWKRWNNHTNFWVKNDVSYGTLTPGLNMG